MHALRSLSPLSMFVLLRIIMMAVAAAAAAGGGHDGHGHSFFSSRLTALTFAFHACACDSVEVATDVEGERERVGEMEQTQSASRPFCVELCHPSFLHSLLFSLYLPLHPVPLSLSCSFFILSLIHQCSKIFRVFVGYFPAD